MQVEAHHVMAVRDAVLNADGDSELWRPADSRGPRSMLNAYGGGDAEVNQALEQMLLPNAPFRGEEEEDEPERWSQSLPSVRPTSNDYLRSFPNDVRITSNSSQLTKVRQVVVTPGEKEKAESLRLVSNIPCI